MRVEQDELRQERDPLLIGVVAVVAALAVGMSAWLLTGVITRSAPDRVTVKVDNQTGLTLSVEAVDASGTVLSLGRMPAGQTSTRALLPVPSSDWTFVAYFGEQEVWRSEPATPEALSDGSHSIRIEPTPDTEELERQGFR